MLLAPSFSMSLLPAPSHPIPIEIYVFIESFPDSATAIGGSPRYLPKVTWKENQFYVKEMLLVCSSTYRDNEGRMTKEESRFQYCIQNSAFPSSLLTQSLLAIDISTLSDGA